MIPSTTLAFGRGLVEPPSSSSVRRIQPPSAVRARSALRAISYADAFVVADPSRGREPAEAWARATLEGAPAAVRAGLLRGWRSLGLRVDDTGAGERVLGWPVARSSHDETVLATTSVLGFEAEIVFGRQHDDLLFCTFVRCTNPLARAVWLPLGPWHRRVVATLLAQGTGR